MVDIFTANDSELYEKYKHFECNFKKFYKCKTKSQIIQFIKRFKISNLPNGPKQKSILALISLLNFLNIINAIYVKIEQNSL